mmetsp:Transcript_25523/g.55555  ORF Transcript_25523/g.55555 Transcript_25523/m.55555 type:complete len:81 (+) Transcript_25523:261-503(+)
MCMCQQMHTVSRRHGGSIHAASHAQFISDPNTSHPQKGLQQCQSEHMELNAAVCACTNCTLMHQHYTTEGQLNQPTLPRS